MPPPATTNARVAEIRAFNRFYTNRIGVLRGGPHGSRHPLPEACVLFELGRQEVTEVAELRHRLDLDAGHLSRLLARMDDQGLVLRERSPEDGRRQRLRLTATGGYERLRLDQASAQQWSGLLDPISDGDQRRLLDAMATVRQVLGGPQPGCAVELRAPVAGELGWIVARHGALYADEHGWGEGFEALVAQVVARFASELVEPWARGLGLGGRLIDACTDFARGAGYRTLALWTNHPLVEARRLYERRGFRLVSEARHAQWGVELVGQELALEL